MKAIAALAPAGLLPSLPHFAVHPEEGKEDVGMKLTIEPHTCHNR
jgi:hypothetical protein